MDFAKKLIKLREDKGLSQYEVADRLGIKRPRYNAWEQGLAKPRADMIKKLAEFFEVSPDYLLGFESNQDIPAWATRKDIRDFKKMLEEDAPVMFDGVPLDKEDKEKVLKVMEAIFWDAKKKNKRKPIDE